jgi:hypothetical protein
MADDVMAQPDQVPLDPDEFAPLEDILASIGYDADDTEELVIEYLSKNPRGIAFIDHMTELAGKTMLDGLGLTRTEPADDQA